jgi:hypothetical protein
MTPRFRSTLQIKRQYIKRDERQFRKSPQSHVISMMACSASKISGRLRGSDLGCMGVGFTSTSILLSCTMSRCCHDSFLGARLPVHNCWSVLLILPLRHVVVVLHEDLQGQQDPSVITCSLAPMMKAHTCFQYRRMQQKIPEKTPAPLTAQRHPSRRSAAGWLPACTPAPSPPPASALAAAAAAAPDTAGRGMQTALGKMPISQPRRCSLQCGACYPLCHQQILDATGSRLLMLTGYCLASDVTYEVTGIVGGACCAQQHGSRLAFRLTF